MRRLGSGCGGATRVVGCAQATATRTRTTVEVVVAIEVGTAGGVCCTVLLVVDTVSAVGGDGVGVGAHSSTTRTLAPDTTSRTWP